MPELHDLFSIILYCRKLLLGAPVYMVRHIKGEIFIAPALTTQSPHSQPFVIIMTSSRRRINDGVHSTNINM
eukprot:scaffold16797_cov67-Skeletonema_dohrnii-CCMP3373.AAC.1